MSAPFADTARSEWTKFRSVPSNPRNLVAAVLLMVGLGAVTARGAGSGYAAMPQQARELFDPVHASLYGGFLFAQISVGTLGVLMVGSEYATGMMRTSMTVVPRRGRLLAAKMVTYGLIALVVGVVSSFAGFLLGQVTIASGGAPTATLGDPGALRAVVGMGVLWALVGLTGVAIGTLLRATMSATTLLVTVNFLIPIIGPRLLSDAAGNWLETYWPISAGLQIINTVQDPDRLTPWTGLGLMAAFTAALLALAFVLFRERDA
ncbi:ABC transporter [Sphaerisporangium melleum]|uniref:ABC transporter n=1 Tax=Sphaerisporangium melleum TaxID=321316 RepID=A0A917VVN6_9ACTN|nr:ABC transporter permease subunit [Sphaerisporangium melleum]GGL18656.1 ABC transporter [Sphaerisporangium melleum]GII74924.1 ABC transporter [Sphaerisporangium melleum]